MHDVHFPISKEAADNFAAEGPIFRSPDIPVLYREAQLLAHTMQQHAKNTGISYSKPVTPGLLLTLHLLYLAKKDIFTALNRESSRELRGKLLQNLSPLDIPSGTLSETYSTLYPQEALPSASAAAEEIALLVVNSMNPAIARGDLKVLFTFTNIREGGILKPYADTARQVLADYPMPYPETPDLLSFLNAPAEYAPDSLSDQLEYIRKRWNRYLSSFFNQLLLRTVDIIKEEERPVFPPGGREPAVVPSYLTGAGEYEAFSMDSDWMPNVVMLAKSTLVWLDQLSKSYGYTIDRLDLIPDRELDTIAERGFNTLWLIGLWERSTASKKIKQSTGNPEAEASAYSLKNYDIAESLGSWNSLDNLRSRCARRGIRLASDMVPNHTGIDSSWVLERPELFLQTSYPPYPAYTYNSQNLSPSPDIGIYLEDHYYDRSDAAVSFKRVDHRTGSTQYIYHGNDGTSMPWNDTAQLDYLNPETRETIIQTIIHVARNFPVIRFDAAMTLAKKHIQRLWYPTPGSGGAIPSRSAYGMEQSDFDQALPVEFWREVVDRIAEEAPDTLLLAEAFWMMESYFVRTLGMHRVYNSAFMNMLKMEENRKYRDTIKNTLSFDPEILKRFVNFMNNPDEDTAVEQFGSGDKYFGVCTLLVTMPGLPMLGHGQVEGYREKYGMEFSRAYWDEKPDQMLIEAHYKRIFPLMKLRWLFSGSQYFALFDVHGSNGIEESVFAYANGTRKERTLVFYNNAYPSAGGWIKHSSPILKRQKDDSRRLASTSLGEALGLTNLKDHFCLLRGFHDGLTYLRRSSDLYENGMFIALKGYETQIFLDIYEVADRDGTYSRLCEHLDGRGTAELELDLKRVRLHAVHTAAEPLFSLETVSLAAAVLTGDEQAVEPLTSRLIETTRSIAAAWKITAFPEDSPLFASRYLPDTEKLSAAVKNLSAIGVQSREPDSSLTHFAANCFSIMPEIPTVLCGWLFCLSIKPAAGQESIPPCSSELLLQEVLHNRLYESGIHSNDSYRTTGAIDMLIEESGWYAALRSRNGKGADKLTELLASPTFRSFSQINWHEGIEWYHKESLQEAFSWLLLSAFLDNPVMPEEEKATLHSVVLDWYKTEAAAAYRVDALL
jgi:glycosidase